MFNKHSFVQSGKCFLLLLIAFFNAQTALGQGEPPEWYRHELSMEGFWFRTISENECEISYCTDPAHDYCISSTGHPDYSGDIVIPSIVNIYDDVTSSYKSFIVSKIGASAFRDCKGVTSVQIPSSVKVISPGAFQGTGISKFVIPSGVVLYGDGECAGGILSDCTSLKEVIFPKNFTEIPGGMFGGCSSLEQIDMPESVTKIGDGAFNGTALRNVKIPKGVKVIRDYTFFFCTQLESVELPENLVEIGDYAFSGCGALSEIEIPSTVTKIGEYAFQVCTNIKKLRLPREMTDIGGVAFQGIGVDEFEFPNNIRELKRGVLSHCDNLRRVTLPESLEIMGSGVLENSPKLTHVTLPSKVRHLGPFVFYACPKLSVIRCLNPEPPYLDPQCFTLSVDKKKYNLEVPVSSFEAYRNAEGWSEFFAETDGITADGALRYVLRTGGNAVLTSCDKSATAVTLHASVGLSESRASGVEYAVARIGAGSFDGCTELKTLTVEATTPPTCEEDCFEQTMLDNCTLIVPKGTLGSYGSADGWKDFANIREAEPSAIDAVNADAEPFGVEGRSIVGYADNTRLVISDLSGRVVADICLKAGESKTLDEGYYIVKTGDRSRKIAIR